MSNLAGIWESNSIKVSFVAPLNIISNTPVMSQDTLNLKRNISRRGKAQRWEISTNLMPSTNSADFFLHNVTNNFSEIVEIFMPQLNLNYDTTANSILTTSSVANAGSLSVNIIGIAVGKRIVKGEFIQFSNHDKVYVTTSNLLSDGSISIFPELQKQVPIGTVMKYRNNGPVLMKAYYDLDNTIGIKFVDGVLSDPGNVKFIEAV